MNRNKASTKVNLEEIIQEYRDLIQEYSLSSDDELIRKLQKLPASERDIMILFIASEYRYGIFSRLLCTNIKYGKQLIENIRNKIINME